MVDRLRPPTFELNVRASRSALARRRAAFDLEMEIAFDVGEAFGKGEATNDVKGIGVKGPQG